MTVGSFILSGVVITAFVTWSIKSESKAKAKKIRETFDGREPLSPKEFYDRYFLATGAPLEVVVGIRKILEEQLDVDLSQLNTEDDFSKNLNFFWQFDSMANVSIIFALEEHFQIKIEDTEAEKLRTISDLVQLVCSKTRNPITL